MARQDSHVLHTNIPEGKTALTLKADVVQP